MVDQIQDAALEGMQEANTELENKQKTRKLAENKKAFKQRIKSLEENMYQFAEKYGPEDYRTQLLMQFHDVVLDMDETMDLIQSVTVASEVIFDAINFFDEAFVIQNELFDTSLQTKYGLISRIKNFFKTRKVMRNISNRMSMMCSRIASIQGMSQTMVVSLRKSTEKMQVKLAKQNAKMEQKRAKASGKKGETAAAPVESRSAQMVRDYLKDHGQASQAPTSETARKPSGDGDFGDIL